jgi:hypothetical protein
VYVYVRQPSTTPHHTAPCAPPDSSVWSDTRPALRICHTLNCLRLAAIVDICFSSMARSSLRVSINSAHAVFPMLRIQSGIPIGREEPAGM